MRTIILLIASNIFMTFAWYFHLKQGGMALMESDCYELVYCPV